MLKLSKIYSNSENIFPEIRFRTGLNIVFASVTRELGDKDSHSLGKTLFIELLDYMLIKQDGSKFFLRKNQFSGFVFYLELQISKKLYVTIRRTPGGKIFLHTTDAKIHLLSLPDEKWEHTQLGVKAARDQLDDLLMFSSLRKRGFNYRKGFRYCFRKQNQYEEIFKVNSTREGDGAWKPYLSGLLGIDSDLVNKKYEANTSFDNIKKVIRELKDIPKASSQSIEAEIALIEVSLSKMKEELDQFNFSKTDKKINKELVDEITEEISKKNNELYLYNQRISAINKSLKAEFNFDLNKIIEIFKEVELHMSNKLVKSYEELIELNKQMTAGRKKRLQKTKKSIQAKTDKIAFELEELNDTLSKLTQALLEKDTFNKYKSLQKFYASEEVRLALLNERLKKMDIAEELNLKLEDEKGKKIKLSKKIAPYTRSRENKELKTAMDIFTGFEEDVLGIGAFFFIEMNKEGNPLFKARLTDQTSLTEGFSYKRVLSALFDLMLLVKHKEDSFYRFVYHDGLLESLDDRVKRRLIRLWRSESEEKGLQLIISVLDSDVPYNEKGAKEYFRDEEIIRELHDQGDDGRLFKMSAF